MAVSAPSDDPSYVYGSPPPPNAVDPGMWARLMGYAGALNPIGSANAAEAPQAPSPGPTIDSARQRAIADAQAQLNAGNASNNIRPPPTGPTPPIISAGEIPVQLPPPFQQPDHPSTMRFPMWPTPPAPAVAPAAAPPAAIANAPLPPPRPTDLGGGAPATVDPRMQGEVPPAQSPWFTTFSRPNQNPHLMGGALAANQSGRGGGGPDPMGMLDLSGIFRGGQPAAAPAAQPRTKINVGKIPASARAEVPPVSPGPMDPSIIARQRMKRPKASSSSQGGGY